MNTAFFELNTAQLKEIAQDLQQKIEAGLAKDNTEIRCLPTYISPQLPVNDKKVLVLDFGGTNFRVAVVEFKAGKSFVYPENGLSKDLSEYMKTKGATRELLFEKMADLIRQVNLDGLSTIGYCFSYPAESTLDGDAKLLRWTKGVVIDDMLGDVVGKPLLDYLNIHLGKKQFTTIKVINDTVASLSVGLTKQGYDAQIGLIVGTGTNMAGFMHSGKIQKLTTIYTQKRMIPVNLESGNFHPAYLTVVDEKLDRYSGTIGEQRFEKAVSGFYLGKIVDLFFSRDDMGENFDAQKLTDLLNYPNRYNYKEECVRIARQVYTRSAQLVAASIAGFVAELAAQDKTIKKIAVTAEGSLFWSKDKNGKDYNQIVSEQLCELLPKLSLGEIQVDLNRLSNANLIGSAIAALS